MSAVAKKKQPTVMRGTRLEVDLDAAVLSLAEAEDRKLAQMIAILVREAMVARGLYQRKPPKPAK